MNCPGHILIYRSKGRSYRDLPMRLSELGTVYRYEKSGVVHGLLRARGFTQDDSHTFCTEEQLGAEIRHQLEFTLRWHRDFGFDETVVEAELSTQPEKSVGEQGRWELSEKMLARALDDLEVPYRLAPGEGAFYGPKIDIHIKDAIGRRWQMGTVQLDFNNPERFGLEYTSPANTTETPYMIHCAKAGSLERFMGVLVEHYAGAFPMWLAPVQVTVIPVADRHLEYAREVASTMRGAGLRAETDETLETVGDKVRRALSQKHPALLVVGDDDVTERTVGLRLYGSERDTRGVALNEARDRLVERARIPQ
jgi:threonyl-tRNA synthetase